MCRTKRVSEWKINEERLRRTDSLRNLAQNRHRDCWNAFSFDNNLDQSDRLMTHRSYRSQENGTHVICQQLANHLRRRLCDQETRRGNRSHEAEVARGDFAYHTVQCQFPESIQGQGEVLVRFEPANVESIAPMCDL